LIPIVASASALRPIATRTPLIAITAVQALCKTIKTRLVALTIQVGLLAEFSGNTGFEFAALLI